MPFDVKMAISALKKFNSLIEEKKEFLTDLDAAIGDADHGINMNRGMKRVIEKLEAKEKEYTNFGALYRDVAMTIMSVVGGSAGPLYGTFFMIMGQKLSDMDEASADELADAMQEGLGGVMSLGKSAVGDKTMVDTLAPAIKTFRDNAGTDEQDAWEACVRAAELGMKDTMPMLARRGRSSYQGERSIGHQDPGATSAFYFISCLRDAFTER